MASAITSISIPYLDQNQLKKGEVKNMCLGVDINSIANNTLKMIGNDFLQIQKQYNNFIKGETDLFQRKDIQDLIQELDNIILRLDSCLANEKLSMDEVRFVSDMRRKCEQMQETLKKMLKMIEKILNNEMDRLTNKDPINKISNIDINV